MKSKVKNVQGSGVYENVNGVDLGNGKKGYYKFEYEFEDGVTLTANHKTAQPKFPIGSEVEYEIVRTHEVYGNSGRVKKPESNNFNSGNSDNLKGIKIGHALNCASVIFSGAGDSITDHQLEALATRIYRISEKMNNEL